MQRALAASLRSGRPFSHVRAAWQHVPRSAAWAPAASVHSSAPLLARQFKRRLVPKEDEAAPKPAPQQQLQSGAYPQQPGQPSAYPPQYPQQPGTYPQQPGQPGAYPQQPGQAGVPAVPPGQQPGQLGPVAAPGGGGFMGAIAEGFSFGIGASIARNVVNSFWPGGGGGMMPAPPPVAAPPPPPPPADSFEHQYGADEDQFGGDSGGDDGDDGGDW